MKHKLLGLMLMFGSVQGQTAIDLKSQTRNVDFGSAASTRPVRTGSTLPATCQTGDLFFHVGNPPGQNLYGCGATNIWAQESGTTSGATIATQLTDFQVVRTSNVQLSIGEACTSGHPCNVRFGSTVNSFTSASTITIASGSGSGAVAIFVSNSGTIVAEHSATAGVALNCVGCVASQVMTPTFPVNSIPLASLTITGGLWESNIVDLRSVYASRSITAGSGIQVMDGLGDAVVSIDPADVPRLGAANVYTGDNDFSASTRIVMKTDAGVPAAETCTVTEVGRLVVRSDAGAQQSSLYLCANTGAGLYEWELVQGSGTQTSGSGWFDLTGSGGGGLTPTTANVAYYVEFQVPAPVKVSQIGYNVISGDGTKYMSWGIYNASCNLVVGTSGRGTLSTGAHLAAVSSVTSLRPGSYFFGYTLESTAVVVSASNRLPAILAAATPPRLFSGSNAPTGSGSTLTMPTTCGTRTGGDVMVPTVYVVE